MQRSASTKATIIFLLLTFALSAIFYVPMLQTGKLGVYVMGLMWCPGIAAILTSLLLKRKLSLLGWRLGKGRYLLWSYLTPLLYTLIAYVIVWLAGWGRFYNEDTVKEMATMLGTANLSEGITILLGFLLAATVGTLVSCVSALGEEIGWRGFLVPNLYHTLGFTRTSLVTGVIWTIWHYPGLFYADYNGGTPAWYGAICFTVLVVSISFIFTWFRMKSNSVWPCALLHASHNLFIQGIFTPLTQDTGNTRYFIDEFGAVLPVISLFFAYYFWQRRKELPGDRHEEVRLVPAW